MQDTIIGKKSNRLTVVELDTKKTAEKNRIYYICKCECGKMTSVREDSIKNGKIKSCGCSRGTHNLTKHFMFTVYKGQISRCTKPNDKRYDRYGARGIKVEYTLEELCKWGDENPKPTPKHSLDRIDNDKNYSFDNIRWADPTTQAINRDVTKKSTGILENGGMWRARIMINRVCYDEYFKNYEDAVWWRCMMEVKREVEEEKKYHKVI